MNPLVLLVVTESEGQVQQIAKTFGVDWPHLVGQIISFSILCFFLYKFAYRPILTILEARRRQIAQGLADTEKIRDELARAEAQRHEIIVKANAEATELIEEARSTATRLQEQENQKTLAIAQQIIAKARQAAEQEHDRMLADAKRDVGRLVVLTTAAVTGKVLTPEDQRRLAEETTEKLRLERLAVGM